MSSAAAGTPGHSYDLEGRLCYIDAEGKVWHVDQANDLVPGWVGRQVGETETRNRCSEYQTGAVSDGHSDDPAEAGSFQGDGADTHDNQALRNNQSRHESSVKAMKYVKRQQSSRAKLHKLHGEPKEARERHKGLKAKVDKLAKTAAGSCKQAQN